MRRDPDHLFVFGEQEPHRPSGAVPNILHRPPMRPELRRPSQQCPVSARPGGGVLDVELSAVAVHGDSDSDSDQDVHMRVERDHEFSKHDSLRRHRSSSQ
jgi:hypothetical protein